MKTAEIMAANKYTVVTAIHNFLNAQAIPDASHLQTLMNQVSQAEQNFATTVNQRQKKFTQMQADIQQMVIANNDKISSAYAQ